MTNLETATVTAAQVEAGLTDSWCYSDAFKEIHGFRPRGEFLNTPEYIADFWNGFNEAFDQKNAEEAAELAALGEDVGMVFDTWMQYYTFLDQKRYEEEQEERAARKAVAAAQAEFFRRGSPVPVMEAWEHGAI